MVLVYSLHHGFYSGTSFIIPNNILLIHYTHPRKSLDMHQNHAISSKFLDKVDDHLEIKKELLDLEYNDKTIEISSVPAIEITDIKHPYPNDKRYISQMNYPSGKYYKAGPCTEADDILIQFSDMKELRLTEIDSIFAMTNTYMQVPEGSIIKKEVRNIRILLSHWLEELSQIYKALYPNKIIYVIHASCRSDYKNPYITPNELSNDLDNMSITEKTIKLPDFRNNFEGIKRKDRLNKLWNTGVEGFTHRYIYPSLSLTKSPNIYRDCDLENNVNKKPKSKNTGGKRKSKKKYNVKINKRYMSHKLRFIKKT